jgi:hypothetical protein
MTEHVEPLDTVVIEQSLDNLVDWLASFAVSDTDRDRIRAGVVTDVVADGGNIRVELIIPSSEDGSPDD